MLVAQIVLGTVLVYFALGLLFGVAFVTIGAGRISPDARGTTIWFRLLILPGSAALWPYLARRWFLACRQGHAP